MKPTYSREGDKSLYDGSAGRTQLIGVLNQDIQPHLANASTESLVETVQSHFYREIMSGKLPYSYGNRTGNSSRITLKKLGCGCRLRGG